MSWLENSGCFHFAASEARSAQMRIQVIQDVSTQASLWLCRVSNRVYHGMPLGTLKSVVSFVCFVLCTIREGILW